MRREAGREGKKRGGGRNEERGRWMTERRQKPTCQFLILPVSVDNLFCVKKLNIIIVAPQN